jgi:hypothetical protein
MFKFVEEVFFPIYCWKYRGQLLCSISYGSLHIFFTFRISSITRIYLSCFTERVQNLIHIYKSLEWIQAYSLFPGFPHSIQLICNNVSLSCSFCELSVTIMRSCIISVLYSASLKKPVITSRFIFINFPVLANSISRYGDWLRAGRPRGRSSSPDRVKNFLFSKSSRPSLGSTQWNQWIPVFFRC